MIRMGLLVSALWCLVGSDLVAGDPGKALVVVADLGTASLLAPVWVDAELRVLINDGQESFNVVNERALKLRQATHFVYHSGRESTLAAMVRERLQMQGAIAVDINGHVARRYHDRRPPQAAAVVSIQTVLSSRP